VNNEYCYLLKQVIEKTNLKHRYDVCAPTIIIFSHMVQEELHKFNFTIDPIIIIIIIITLHYQKV